MGNDVENEKTKLFPSYEEIAQEMGTTRQYVRQTAVSAMNKVFRRAEKLEPDFKSHEIFWELIRLFEIPEMSIREFFKSFPTDIQQEIAHSLGRKI